MHLGLFFGSFNPIHIGHLAIANYIIEYTEIDKVMFVVSPQNPFKEKKSLIDNQLRYEMVEKAIGLDNRFGVSNIEFTMPTPSYTIDTLMYLKERKPNDKLSLIMGSDQLPFFHKWKNYNVLVDNYHRFVYPRPGIEKINLKEHKNLTIVNAPQMEVSSSFIRKSINEGKDVRYFLPIPVFEFIEFMNLYR